MNALGSIKRRKRPAVALALVVMMLLTAIAAARVQAQSGGGYSLTWNNLDGGGPQMSSGTFSLNGSAGQPEPGTLIGGEYTLTGGFWPGMQTYYGYLPLLRK